MHLHLIQSRTLETEENTSDEAANRPGLPGPGGWHHAVGSSAPLLVSYSTSKKKPADSRVGGEGYENKRLHFQERLLMIIASRRCLFRSGAHKGMC